MDFSAWVESSCDLSLLPTMSIPSRGNESLLGTHSVPACICPALSCVPLGHRQRGRGLHLLYFVFLGEKSCNTIIFSCLFALCPLFFHSADLLEKLQVSIWFCLWVGSDRDMETNTQHSNANSTIYNLAGARLKLEFCRTTPARPGYLLRNQSSCFPFTPVTSVMLHVQLKTEVICGDGWGVNSVMPAGAIGQYSCTGIFNVETYKNWNIHTF